MFCGTGKNHHSILITGGVSSANNHRNLWIHSVGSDSDFPRPVHCVVPAMRVNGMMTNQISDHTISNIDESLDVNVGITPATSGKRYSKLIMRKIYLAKFSLIT